MRHRRLHFPSPLKNLSCYFYAEYGTRSTSRMTHSQETLIKRVLSTFLYHLYVAPPLRQVRFRSGPALRPRDSGRAGHCRSRRPAVPCACLCASASLPASSAASLCLGRPAGATCRWRPHRMASIRARHTGRGHRSPVPVPVPDLSRKLPGQGTRSYVHKLLPRLARGVAPGAYSRVCSSTPPSKNFFRWVSCVRSCT